MADISEGQKEPFSAREYAKALNLLLQLYTVAQRYRIALGLNHDKCLCIDCKTMRAVHTFIYHGEG